MFVQNQEEIQEKIPTFILIFTILEGVTITLSKFSIFMKYVDKVKNDLKKITTAKKLRNHPIVRAYREFYWHYLKIDPTKIRPSGEALARRLLRDKDFPKLVNLVDAYNLASARTFISFGAYDFDKLHFPLYFKFAEKEQPFFGIGMKKPKFLKGNELILMDQEGIVNVYPYRDANRTKITGATKRVLLITAGVPNLEEKTLVDATKIAIKYIKKFVPDAEVKDQQIIIVEGKKEK